MIPLPFSGMGAFVWKIRNWAGAGLTIEEGVKATVAKAVAGGYRWIALKICNGYLARWEGAREKQNADYLPALVEALRAAGIEAVGWGWPYGRWSNLPYYNAAEREANVAIAQIKKYGMRAFFINAEGSWIRAKTLRMDLVATQYMNALRAGLPDVALLLNSYRFTSQTKPTKLWNADFPWPQFLAECDAHAPQVYWYEDNRPDGGALQLEASVAELIAERDLPIVPLAPLHQSDKGWKPSAGQIVIFLDAAKELKLPAVCAYSLDGVDVAAMFDQLAAWQGYPWEDTPPAPAKHVNDLTPDEFRELTIYSMQHPRTTLINKDGSLVAIPPPGEVDENGQTS